MGSEVLSPSMAPQAIPRVNGLPLRRRVLAITRVPIAQRPVGALLGLRDPAGQHTDVEASVLADQAAGRTNVVEIGVAEGVSAAILRRAMDPSGRLSLVDPLSSRYPISPRKLVARRVVEKAGGAPVNWIYQLSLDAVRNWTGPIDLLFIDADHAEQACENDWMSWSPFVVRGGRVAFHDSAVSPTSHAGADWGPVLVADRHFRDPATRDEEWFIVEEVDSLTIVERR